MSAAATESLASPMRGIASRRASIAAAPSAAASTAAPAAGTSCRAREVMLWYRFSPCRLVVKVMATSMRLELALSFSCSSRMESMYECTEPTSRP